MEGSNLLEKRHSGKKRETKNFLSLLKETGVGWKEHLARRVCEKDARGEWAGEKKGVSAKEFL